MSLDRWESGEGGEGVGWGVPHYGGLRYTSPHSSQAPYGNAITNSNIEQMRDRTLQPILCCVIHEYWLVLQYHAYNTVVITVINKTGQNGNTLSQRMHLLRDISMLSLMNN